MFSEGKNDFLESLPLNMRVQTLMQVQKQIKEKRKKKKQKLEKQIKVKRKENKRKYIIYTITYLPGNGAENLTRSKS
jgi:hypothetical protein